GALIPYILKSLLYEIVIIGGFFLIGIYHFIIFAFRKNDYSALYVGLIALAVSLRTLFMNTYLSSLLLKIDDWNLLVKLEYSSEIVGFLSLVFLMKHLYAAEVHRLMFQLSIA